MASSRAPSHYRRDARRAQLPGNASSRRRNSRLDSSMTPAGGRLRRRQIARGIPRGKSQQDTKGKSAASAWLTPFGGRLRSWPPPLADDVSRAKAEPASPKPVTSPTGEGGLLVDRDHDVRPGRP